MSATLDKSAQQALAKCEHAHGPLTAEERELVLLHPSQAAWVLHCARSFERRAARMRAAGFALSEGTSGHWKKTQ